jgi:adenine-specific DNA-methyltransferase
MKYLCGVINSKLISFLFSYSSNKIEAGSFPRISVGDLKKLPIKEIDFSDKGEVTIHDEICKYVDLIIGLNADLLSEKVPSQSERMVKQIEYLQEKIDQIVYKLYKLDPEEIAIVEGASNA